VARGRTDKAAFADEQHLHTLIEHTENETIDQLMNEMAQLRSSMRSKRRLLLAANREAQRRALQMYAGVPAHPRWRHGDEWEASLKELGRRKNQELGLEPDAILCAFGHLA